MDIFVAVVVLIVLGYFFIRSIRNGKVVIPETDANSTSAAKPSLDQQDKDAAVAQLDDAHANPATYRYQSPVVLLRKPRAKTNIAVDGTSWFGGLPSLGGHMWPQSRDGSLMHHVAQIDLAELATVNTPEGFPKSGNLAFFVDVTEWPYKGSVVYIQIPDNKKTQPITDLPRLAQPYNGDGYAIEGFTKENAPRQFPRWPISFVPIDIIEDDDTEIDPVYDALKTIFPELDDGYDFYAGYYEDTHPELSIPSKWDTAQKFANLLTSSRHQIIHRIKYLLGRVDSGREGLVALNQEAKKIAATRPNAGESHDDFTVRKDLLVKKNAERRRHLSNITAQYTETLEFMVANTESFVALETEVVAWAYKRDRWDAMDKNDVAQLEKYAAAVQTRFRDKTLGLHLFMSSSFHLSRFVDLTLQEMVLASNEIYDQLPKQVRDDFDNQGRIARRGHHHQMFSLARTVQGYENHARDYLLLKLGFDRVMNWDWGEEDAYFWITPDDLKNQRWENVQVIIGHE